MSHVKSPDLLDNIDKIGREPGTPLHTQVRNMLRNLIEEHFVDGQQFWTDAVLVQRLGVSQITIRRAILDLSGEGILDRRGAKGTFVRKRSKPVSTHFAVGIVVPEYDSDVTTGLVNQITNISRDRGRRVSMYHTHMGEKASAVIDILSRSFDDEMFILLGNSPQMTQQLYKTLLEQNCRVVNIDSLVEGYPGVYVGVDDAEGIRIGLNHLTSLGHRQIVLLVNEPAEKGTVVARIHAFDEQTREQGLNECRIVHCQTTLWEDAVTAAYQKMEKVWNSALRPTAIFTISDGGAFGVLRWLSENNIRVPDQVSVLGFGNDSPGRHTTPGLTTIGQPYRRIAEEAINVLEQGNMDEQQILFAPELIVRESTAAPRSSS